MQKTIDKLLPRWVYYLLLYAAIFYANYFYNMAVIYDTLSIVVLENIANMPIILNIFIVAGEVCIFELISRLYYNLVQRNTGFKGLTCTKTQFVDTLRVFFIFKSIVLGSATLIVYFIPYLIPLAIHIFNLFFSLIFYYLFFLYIKNKYINMELGGRTFLQLAIPFLVYSVLLLIFNLVL